MVKHKEEVVMYSTNCPKCSVLEKKLQEKGVYYTKITNVEEMLELGIESVPMLKVGDELFGFPDAVKWVNKQ